ncbi:hypothetical protein A2755_02110 [Candidatus Wolfebacteria bacterium RIFCSPHIGHO2_01_FULL_48_22]|uniref:DUF1902 domain-containing protein n=2 Tax=Candidatus Wolfeibacteriota TaxID=1752735 RepID=A0A1F8DT68_9BACT|nr:MAG: hypothetical protein A2755_02110 [Candidatus Wolfebacteria bacterium RIFCSPHIGHO2_01_FULL_48_22]OGM92322.1 MAG: hypothetical protein A2935_00960 [Candidatus Wolfebacteria bacterium RIFCSPLOWO2_01_FULL_47_17b]
MKKTINFTISKDNIYYFAVCTDFPIVTQAKTLDELAYNIKEATELHFDGENLTELGLSSNPRIRVSLLIQ